MSESVYIGTSGWGYDSWKDDFYQDVPRDRWLEHCVDQFNSLEINATFYRLQEEATLDKWRRATSPTFRFSIKGHRYITHNKSLKDPKEPVVRSRDNARPLQDKLGAVVWQLPEQLHRDLDRLEEFAAVLSSSWSGVDHAIEFRHRSWFDESVAACLREHNHAVCISDAADWPLWDEITADFVYLRFHGHTRTYASSYSSGLLDKWAERIRSWAGDGARVYAYFDNDSEGAAPWDALKLAERVEAE